MSSFKDQVVIYAKHWYGTSNDRLDDLKTLLSRWSEIDKEHISDRDIHELVIDAFCSYCDASKHDFREAMLEMIGMKWGSNIPMLKDRKPLDCMLGQLSICEGRHCKLEEKIEGIGFGVKAPKA